MASVASMPVPNAVTSSGKRRRDIAVAIEDTTISSKIAKLDHLPATSSPPPEPIVTVRNSTSAKRPQLKYDPSVPMTKEETSKWRADQRRKRNRESAAACRKRQRDRISELEVEVSEWKVKFNNALLQLQNAEGEEAAMELKSMLEEKYVVPPPKNPDMVGSSGISSRCKTPPNTSDVGPEIATSSMQQQQQITTIVQQGSSNIVSPNDQRPKFIPPLISSSDEVLLDELHFPVLEESIIKASDLNVLGGVSSAASDSLMSRVENRQHLNEKITRPAKSRLLKTSTTSRFDRLKITGAVYPPLTSIESVCDDLLQVVPDSCLSLTEKKTMPFPETCPSLVPSASSSVSGPASVAADDAATMAAAAADVLMSGCSSASSSSAADEVTTDESDEDNEIGEFLMDAVNWL